MTLIQKIEQLRDETIPAANTSARVAEILLDMLYSFPSTLPSSDVPGWAKTPEKPEYLPEEIGAERAGSVTEHDTDENAHQHILNLISAGGNSVGSISVNGVPVEKDITGNVDIVTDLIPEIKDVGDSVSTLESLNIGSRLQTLETTNPDVKVSAELIEIPDGIRDIFTLNRAFVAGSTQVWVNGIKITNGSDYNEIGHYVIQFIGYAPKVTTNVQILLTEKTNLNE